MSLFNNTQVWFQLYFWAIWLCTIYKTCLELRALTAVCLVSDVIDRFHQTN